jgi:Uma2 family endonuclease
LSAVSKYISPEEYLALERASEIRHQYFRGEMFAMSGASRAHNVINLNLARALGNQLAGGPCEVYVNDMRVKVSATGLYTYPDIAIACADRKFEDVVIDTLLNPTVLAEVLSDSTEAYDRGDKFRQYQKLDSLREYVLVSQKRVCVEHFLRQGNQWVLTVWESPSDTLVLSTIDCRVALHEIYDRVEFPPAP